LNFKLNNARKFLMEGDKVKVTVMFRGREMVHTSRGRTQLDAVRKQLGAIAKMESAPRMEGRFMSMILVADREAVAEAKRLAEGNAEDSDATAEDVNATPEESKKEEKETAAEAPDENVEANESAKEASADEPAELSPAASD
jgi:translation initiation factor IF-3